MTAIPVPANLWAEGARLEANAQRAAARGLEPCALCGRGVKPGSGWVVEATDGGATLAQTGTADETDSGYMGAWVLGPECARQVPLAYRTRWHGWDETA